VTPEKRVAARDQRQKLCFMPEQFEIRLTTVADAALIAWQRARMFQEMEMVPGALFDGFRELCETRLRDLLRTGEYVGWLAYREQSPNEILAGAGVQLRRVLPHPVGEPLDEIVIAEGRHAIVLNVWTQPQWRRRGLATLLIRQILSWAEAERLDRLVLHASDGGRAVYERLGFIQTNEMRFRERLDLPSQRTAL
jgi:GNAT superfamily N-acetyltransferase